MTAPLLPVVPVAFNPPGACNSTPAPAAGRPAGSSTRPTTLAAGVCANNDASGKIDKNMRAAYGELLFPRVHFIFIPLTSFNICRPPSGTCSVSRSVRTTWCDQYQQRVTTSNTILNCVQRKRRIREGDIPYFLLLRFRIYPGGAPSLSPGTGLRRCLHLGTAEINTRWAVWVDNLGK